MNFEDLKDQIYEKLHTLWAKIQDDPNYQSAIEQYESLAPNVQTAIKLAGAGLGLLMVLWWPVSMISSSNAYLEEYNESKSLIRDLLTIKRTKDQGSQVPEPPPVDRLIGDIRRQIESSEITPEQILGINRMDLTGSARLALPKEIQQVGIEVSLRKINLKQIIDLGNVVESAHAMAKLTGLSARANPEDPHYFDVNFKVTTFELPAPPPPPEEAKPTGRRPPKRGNTPSANEESDL